MEEMFIEQRLDFGEERLDLLPILKQALVQAAQHVPRSKVSETFSITD